MSERVYQIGQRVYMWCTICGEERGHVISSVTARGRVTRVVCPVCQTRGTFKNGTNSSAKTTSGKVAQPYDWTHTYRVRQMIMHLSYGEGEVVALIEPKKMDVLFADRIRRLIHSR